MARMEIIETPAGKPATVFIPDNVSEDTPIVCYSVAYKGVRYLEDQESRVIEQYTKDNCENAIVVFTHDRSMACGGTNVDSHRYQKSVISAAETVAQMCGINNPNIIQSGFSAAFGDAIRTTSHFIETHPDCGRQIIIANDGALSDKHGSFANISDKDYNLIKNNDSIIISYSQPNYWEHEGKLIGLPILYVVPEFLPNPNEYEEGTYGNYHIRMSETFFSDGVNQALANFAVGKGSLPEGYKYKFYDPSTGQIRDVDPGEAATLLRISSSNVTFVPLSLKFDNLLRLNDVVINSDDVSLQNALNGIIHSVKSSSIIQGGYDSGGFTSTTKVPTSIPSVVYKYFDCVGNLMELVVSQTQTFADIANRIIENDKELEEETNDLDDVNSQEDKNDIYNVNDTNIEENNNSNVNINNLDNVNGDSSLDKESDKNSSLDKEPDKNSSLDKEPDKNNGENINQNNNNNNHNINSGSINTGGNGNIDYHPNNGIVTKPHHNNDSKPNIDSTTKPDINTDIVPDIEGDLALFPLQDYDSLISNGNSLVYQFNDNCRIVIHSDGNNLVGLEHYYKFASDEEAQKIINILNNHYKDNMISDIQCYNGNIRVLFNSKYCKNISLNKILNKYNSLDKIVKEM